jgi:hypothetical protein
VVKPKRSKDNGLNARLVATLIAGGNTSFWLPVSAIAALVAIVTVPRLPAFKTGAQLNAQLLSGKFDNSEVGRQFATWFAEQPDRETQRDRFVQFALAMGCASGRVGERLMRSTMQSWKDPNRGFGSLLAAQLDELIVFDPPRNDADVEKQTLAIAEFERFKNELRVLDRA